MRFNEKVHVVGGRCQSDTWQFIKTRMCVRRTRKARLKHVANTCLLLMKCENLLARVFEYRTCYSNYKRERAGPLTDEDVIR